MTRRTRLLAVAAGIALLPGCASPSEGAEEPLTLQVYAAASLQEPFEQISAEFEADHDGVEVALTSAGSSTLAEQIVQGAPADVFASANPATMDTLGAAGLEATTPVPFATNHLAIAVPAGNPAGVTGLDSLTATDLHLVLCAPQVPCGAAAEEVERSAGLTFTPVSEEQSVTDVLGKVTSGEADAGLVYVTDLRRSGGAAEGIEIPAAHAAATTYPITTVAGSPRSDLAAEFLEQVTGERGRRVLAEHGFGAP